MRPLRPSDIQHLSGARAAGVRAAAPIVLTLVRDAVHHVESFVRYHFDLGFEHIVALDNGSRDGTVERLSSFERVTVLGTELSYRDYKTQLRRYLFRRFGRGRWCLVADIDERFTYPHASRLPLAGLIDYLDSRQCTAMAAQMIDLFPAELGARARPAWEPSNRTHHYDVSACVALRHEGGGNRLLNPELRVLCGGIRAQVFGVSPCLTKHPLVKYDGLLVLNANDNSHDIAGATIADVSGVLLHDKFSGPFRAQVERAVVERNYYNASSEYRAYAAVLRRRPRLRLVRSTARRFVAADDLIGAGIMLVTPTYLDFVRRFRATAGRGSRRGSAERDRRRRGC